MNALRCLVITGPTATGKTRLAVALARRFDGEIVSADSRQVYRGLDIGTGKDLDEYGDGPEAVPVHLLDIAAPDEEYNLFRFTEDARQALAAIDARGRLPVIAGGTPLYVNALLEDYDLEGGRPDPALRAELEPYSDEALRALLEREDPELYARTDRTQRKRLIRAIEIARTRQRPRPLPPRRPLEPLILAPFYPREAVHRRIEERLDRRLRQGMIEEVRRLHENGLSWERLEWLGLEYRWISRYLRGLVGRTEMRDILLARIRRFCKAQDIWFRKMERRGHAIHWIPGGDLNRAAALVTAFLTGETLPPPAIRLEDIRYGPRSSRPG